MGAYRYSSPGGIATLMAVAACLASPVLSAYPLQQQAAHCCKSLAQTTGLSGKVFPNSTQYDDRMGTYWSVSAALDPWCIVQPSNAQDISTTIKTIVRTSCPFGIRSGGHGSWAGENSISDGVTIDFGNMNAISYNPDTNIASIEPGNHWQAVYDALVPHGVTVTGGRAGTVGVGGFISGGGNSFHSASHGMACDTVANFEVVLGDGSIVNANATCHPDLWVALKGGSANFGLITRFDMYAIKFPNPTSPDIWGGNLVYNLSSQQQVIDAFVDFGNNVSNDENSSSIIYWAFIPSLGGMILNAALENTLAKVKPPAFDGYYSVSGITADTTTVDRMSTITEALGSSQPAGFRNVWFTLSFQNDARKHYELTANFTSTLLVDSNFNTLCMFQPITQSIAQKGVQKGGNVMGLDYYTRKGNGVLFLATLALDGADQEAIAIPIMKAYTDDVYAYAKRLGVAWDWQYLNYANKQQDPIATVGRDALNKIRAASMKYDPQGVFQTLRKSGFKIPKSV